MKRGCPTDDEMLDFLRGTLAPDSAQTLSDHVDGCEHCRAALERLESHPDPWLDELTIVPSSVDFGYLSEAAFRDAQDRVHAMFEHGTLGDFHRYERKEKLGEGGFGEVFQAFDSVLQRDVVLKIARQVVDPLAMFEFPFLEEARVVASLDHPNIIPVYDAGLNEDGRYFIVFKMLNAESLAQRMRKTAFAPRHTAEIVAAVATALDAAHQHHVVHRDIKPSNILLDTAERCFVADFGLALTADRFGQGPKFAGTPAYMSPEQARGEGHRVDGRSDIYSLGVVFYELLVGRRPFSGETREDLLDQISKLDVRPPRQLVPQVPRELERICLKMLSLRMPDRYSVARDISVDLHAYLSTSELESLQHSHDKAPANDKAVANARSAATSAAVATSAAAASDIVSVSGRNPGPTPASSSRDDTASPVVPKGLRSFGAEDADFFLRLLPGPRDRFGFPNGLRFWKSRIEAQAGEQPFSVGVLYSPSGSGKSSLVKAGLLPNLSSRINSLYFEMSSEAGDAVILSRLQKQFSGLEGCTNLSDALATIRAGRILHNGQKLLLVLDQFEQFLHGRNQYDQLTLPNALRQCDGERVQALLLVRVDFWMSLKRFMDYLEIPLREGENTAALDLFDERHAATVLTAFGRAYGALPNAPLSDAQQAFIKEAVHDLAEEGQVICVRIALFAQMMRGKEWTPKTLSDIGGAQGVGVAFLNEVFSPRTAPPEYRFHLEGIQAVLRHLLPDPGTSIKGHLRSVDSLRAVAGYSRRDDFPDVLRILDSELRLITPAASDAHTETELGTNGSPNSLAMYQLTHDYVVEPLRQWLTQKQLETRRGRAAALLAEMTAQWRRNPTSRFLPSLWEWCFLSLFAPRTEPNSDARRMLRTANRKYVSRIAAFGVVLVAFATMAIVAQQHLSKQTSMTIVRVALSASPDTAGVAMNELNSHRRYAIPQLQAIFDASTSQKERVRAAVGLSRLNIPHDSWLFERLASLPAGEVQIVSQAFTDASKGRRDQLLGELESASDSSLRIRLAAILLSLGDSRGIDYCTTYRPDPILRTTFIDQFGRLRTGTEQAINLMKDSPPHIQSGLSAALVNFSDNDLEGELADRRLSVIRDLLETSPDAAVHSTALWALRKLGQSPTIQPTPPVSDRNWFVNQHKMTMVRIPKGSYVKGYLDHPEVDGIPYEHEFTPVAHRVEFSRSFFASVAEVEVGLFREFLATSNRWQEVSTSKSADTFFEKSAFPSESCPAGGVVWLEAILFANWLSEREGRKPCYHIPEKLREIAFDPKKWTELTCDVSASGYRLPTDSEWEYMCRAGTTTLYYFGNDFSVISSYAVYQLPWTRPTKERLPNAWGLFDMHGNVFEWCNNWGEPQPETPEIDPQGPAKPPGVSPGKIIRGGAYGSPHPRWLRSVRSQKHTMPFGKDPLLGFRLICNDTN